jgi:predicted lipid-binding transport protein (Tim44 family)
VGRVLGFALGVVVLVASLIFSVVVFAILLGVAVLVGGYLWWRTRDLRRQIREQMQAQDAGRGPMPDGASRERRPPAADDNILEGDFIREARRDDQKEPER